MRFKRSGPPAGTNDTSDGRRPACAREGEVVDQMGAAGEAHAAFGGCVGRGTQGTEEGLLPPSAAGVALVHLLEDQLQLELMADEVLTARQRRRKAHGGGTGDLRTGRLDAGRSSSVEALPAPNGYPPRKKK